MRNLLKVEQLVSGEPGFGPHSRADVLRVYGKRLCIRNNKEACARGV